MATFHTAKLPAGGPDSNVTEKQSKAISKETLLSDNFNPRYIHLLAQESIILGGGAAAILLQVGEAGVAAGVNEHSNFAYRALDRLRTTMTFVYCMAYGTAQERRTIVEMVDRIHAKVNGTLNEGRDKGKRYDSLDPHLQLWVAATLYWTAIEVYQQLFGQITDETLHDRIYQEYSILATSLQVTQEMWPADRAAFYRYFDDKVANMEITQHARDVAKDLLYDAKLPFYMKPAMPLVRTITAEIMPERLRREYNLKTHHTIYKFYEIGAKTFYRPLPAVIRSIPVRYFMWDMRKRLQKNMKIFDKA